MALTVLRTLDPLSWPGDCGRAAEPGPTGGEPAPTAPPGQPRSLPPAASPGGALRSPRHPAGGRGRRGSRGSRGRVPAVPALTGLPARLFLPAERGDGAAAGGTGFLRLRGRAAAGGVRGPGGGGGAGAGGGPPAVSACPAGAHRARHRPCRLRNPPLTARPGGSGVVRGCPSPGAEPRPSGLPHGLGRALCVCVGVGWDGWRAPLFWSPPVGSVTGRCESSEAGVLPRWR